MRRLVSLLVIIFLASCGSAAPTTVPTNTPTGGPRLAIPASAKQYSGGEEQIDVYMNGIKNMDSVGKVTRQDFYLVTEPMIEVYRFYRDAYKSDTIEGTAPQPDATTFVMFVKTFGSGREYTIVISYIGMGTIGRADGLLALTVTQ